MKNQLYRADLLRQNTIAELVCSMHAARLGYIAVDDSPVREPVRLERTTPRAGVWRGGC